MRTLYLLGSIYTGLCLALFFYLRPVKPAGGEPPTTGPVATGSAETWFQAMKPFCNSVEVGTRIRQSPPPAGKEGAGYSAACYALAGKIDQARAEIEGLPMSDRGYAAWIVFNIGHPVADAGDDKSAGPIMELVLEFWPDNYMALYHAGMSEYALGQSALARTHLRQFLELYKENDGWRSNGVEVLGRLEGVEKP